MFAYQLRLAWLSLRRNPILSLLLVGGIALGIMVSMGFVTAQYRFSGDPIPQKSGRLFYVQMDSWNPERPWDDDDPSEPPNQLTYTDAMAVMASDIPTHKTAMYKASLTVHPEGENERPYRGEVRMCFGGFFPMFDVPFLYGSGWDSRADAGPEAVIVIDTETNQRLFGGEDSVGRTVRIEDRDFRVVGVMARWHPFPMFHDTHNDPYGDPEPILMPFRFNREFEAYSWGNTSNWKYYEGDGYEDFLQSESVWIQSWVQLDDARQKDEFMAFLDAYVMEQKKLGRFERPLNNKLRNVMEWLRFEEVVPEEVTAILIISLLFLLVCSVNLIGILLGKFMARAPEVGVRRALGASRRAVFLQHLIECEVIGIAGGILGLGLSKLFILWAASLFDSDFNFPLDWNLFLMALALAMLSALVAGAYPAWRICRIQPGVYLKTQ